MSRGAAIETALMVILEFVLRYMRRDASGEMRGLSRQRMAVKRRHGNHAIGMREAARRGGRR